VTALRIGDVAREAGVSADTIRHYERKGVLDGVARDDNGYRRYSEESVRRVRIVRRALSIGFTLDELAALFRQRRGGTPPCRRVRALVEEKMTELDERIRTLNALRETLGRTVASWDEKLAATPEGGFAYLLDDLG
jgi:DNA-binding transcriptional MerR regulator